MAVHRLGRTERMKKGNLMSRRPESIEAGPMPPRRPLEETPKDVGIPLQDDALAMAPVVLPEGHRGLPWPRVASSA